MKVKSYLYELNGEISTLWFFKVNYKQAGKEMQKTALTCKKNWESIFE